jgi:hypothetical protein
MLMSGVLAWAGYVTSYIQGEQLTVQVMIDRLARIETKLDIMMSKEKQ